MSYSHRSFSQQQWQRVRYMKIQASLTMLILTLKSRYVDANLDLLSYNHDSDVTLTGTHSEPIRGCK